MITNRHKTNYIKGNYNNKTELSLNYQIWLTCIKLHKVDVDRCDSRKIVYVCNHQTGAQAPLSEDTCEKEIGRRHVIMVTVFASLTFK